MVARGSKSIKCPRVYRALKRKGYGTRKAAMISNGLRKRRGHC